jgi:hypothetical protein
LHVRVIACTSLLDLPGAWRPAFFQDTFIFVAHDRPGPRKTTMRYHALLPVLLIAGTARAGVMDEGPAAPPPRFEGQVTRADSDNAVDRSTVDMTRSALPPDLLRGLIAAGLLGAAAAYGAEAAEQDGDVPYEDDAAPLAD